MIALDFHTIFIFQNCYNLRKALLSSCFMQRQTFHLKISCSRRRFVSLIANYVAPHCHSPPGVLDVLVNFEKLKNTLKSKEIFN